jgi:hypothetical protein
VGQGEGLLDEKIRATRAGQGWARIEERATLSDETGSLKKETAVTDTQPNPKLVNPEPMSSWETISKPIISIMSQQGYLNEAA